eukprot:scaffold44631_cov66-Phaeocystis_antarctica.AAC.1
MLCGPSLPRTLPRSASYAALATSYTCGGRAAPVARCPWYIARYLGPYSSCSMLSNGFIATSTGPARV